MKTTEAVISRYEYSHSTLESCDGATTGCDPATTGMTDGHDGAAVTGTNDGRTGTTGCDGL